MMTQQSPNGVWMCACCARRHGVSEGAWQNWLDRLTWRDCGGCGKDAGCVDVDLFPVRVPLSTLVPTGYVPQLLPASVPTLKRVARRAVAFLVGVTVGGAK